MSFTRAYDPAQSDTDTAESRALPETLAVFDFIDHTLS
jgi:hypothetical protein